MPKQANCQLSAEAIARALDGTRTGGQWLAHCPAHEDRKPSLSIRQGERGVIFNCLAGCDFRDVRDTLRRAGLFPEFRPGERREKPAGAIPALIAATQEELRNRERAYQLWAYADAWLSGTPAETYLRRRGIWEAVDPTNTPMRFARIRHPQTREENVPAIIIPRHNVRTSAVEGVQRVFLTEDGCKYRRQRYLAPDDSAPLADAKISLGIAPDSWAMLHNQERRTCSMVERFDNQAGEFFRDEVEHVETTDKLVLAEGMENALSASLIPERPAWARCGGFPATIWLPDTVRDVLIAADNDISGNSERKARVLRSFIRGTGRKCDIAIPVTIGRDFNDELLRRAAV